MQEPPTSTIQPSPTHGPRFVRGKNGAPPGPPKPPKPKLKKLRLALLGLGLGVLALISTVFGMLMAVASDLPSLDSEAQFKAAENSVLYPRGPDCPELDPDKCPRIAKLTGNLNRILVKEGEISPNLKNAVIAIEDRRFYSHEGVDYAGIARALSQDILQRKAAQGGSTITQQFVKNALSAQGDRSVFQKLREAALAYHLERKWSKEKILTQYLNTVYFGNGAYGVEAAARTYFGDGDEPDERESATDDAGVTLQQPTTTTEEEEDPDARESRLLSPAEAALLAGMISSPAMYDPLQHPQAARARRDLVLSRMLDQSMITRSEYDDAVRQAVPDEDQVDPPDVESDQPYFTSWVTGQLLDRYTAAQVFSGGLSIRTTIDPELQAAAEQAIVGRLAGIGPSASLVAIDNDTGEVRAMVGGPDFNARPFNLATNGHRQPGSAIKPFILARALADGVDPNSSWASQPKEFPVPGTHGKEVFPVSNYEDSYLGTASLWSATAASDNSVFAELGIKVGTKRIARLARRMGIRTKLSTNPAMTLGGLEEGVTPLEMAYAYSTIANHGYRTQSSFLPDVSGPIGFDAVEGRGIDESNKPTPVQVLPRKVADLEKEMLHLVVTSGTGKAAQVGDEYIWGKTGTTENYGDAWFVGGNDDMTVAIWVGYADKVQSMETEHAGSPVAGGTFPAEIFHDFMTAWVEMREARRAARHKPDDDSTETVPVTPAQPVDPNAVPEADQPADAAPQDQGGTGGTGQDQPEADTGTGTPPDTPDQNTPPPDQPATPTQPPSDGGGTGGGVTPGTP